MKIKTILTGIGVVLMALCSTTIHAAGGACPTEANYINPANNGVAGSLVTLSTIGITSCYFSSTNTSIASDSNNGTSESTPFLHVPGMVNCTATCATVTPAAGEGFIIEGGSVYHYFATGGGNVSIGLPAGWPTSGTSNATGFSFSHSGTSANPIYLGFDPAWFIGASWVRPIITEDNAPNSSTTSFLYHTATNTINVPGIVSSCTYPSGDLVALGLIGGSNVIVDNFEFTGMCYADVSNNNNVHWYIKYYAGSPPTNTLIGIYENYFHGITHVAFCNLGITSTGSAINAAGSGYVTGDTVAVTGGAPTLLQTGTVTASGGAVTAITWNTTGCGTGYSIGSSLATQALTGSGTGLTIKLTATTTTVSPGGQFMQGSSQGGNIGTQILFNVFDLSDGDDTSGSTVGVDSDAYIFAYNVINHMGGTNIIDNCHSIHDNLWEYVNNATDGTAHTDLWFCIGEAASNNFFYNNLRRYIGTEYNNTLSAFFWFNGQAGFTDYIFNNVSHDMNCSSNCDNIEPATAATMLYYNNTGEMSNSGVTINKNAGSSNVITSQNNHWIIPNGTTAGCAAAFNQTSNVNGGVTSCSGDLFQTVSVANGQGYTSANDFQPKSGGSTVGAGANENSISGPFGTAFLSSTSAGVTYNTTNHTAVSPFVTPLTRPISTAWDLGAYQFAGSTPPPVPPAPTGLTYIIH